MKSAGATSALALAVMLSGCAPAVIVAGGATAVVVAQDRRSVGAQLDDETIEIKAGNALSREAQLKDHSRISVTSFNGIVLLTGEAANSELRDLALAQVRTVPNIRRIVNEIRIADPTSFGARSGDTWITTKVKGKLAGVSELPSNQIKVVSENNAVYLMGIVSRKEADLASEAARGVGGVERVVRVFEYTD
ncbi:MAG: divisome-associated lipoprotein YraP [Pseudomonadota bacterium]|nr:MAG: divisome-associated lipoprotein YraP [Pseudomonadota bacterium]